LATLVNKKHTDDKLDLDKLEKSMIGSAGIKIIRESDPAQEFRNTIRELSTDTGINLDDEPEDLDPPDHRSSRRDNRDPRGRTAPAHFSNRSSRHPPDSRAEREGDDEDPGDDDDGSGSESGSYSGSESGSYSGSESGSYSDSEEGSNVEEFVDDDSASAPDSRVDDGGDDESVEDDRRSRHRHSSRSSRGDSGRRYPSVYDSDRSRPRNDYPDPYYNRPRGDSYDPNYRSGRDVSRNQYLDEALRTYAGTHSDVNIEREREEDTKATLLEDIDELLGELERDEVDLSRIPSVNQDSPIALVKKVHKILRMKYDRRRCNSLGKEVILAGAQGLEYICDGKRKIGPFQPDLTGWHNTVRSKLSRMRYETSTIVAGLMQEYNIGPTTRVLMELIPSMILYSHMRKEQHGKSNYSPDQMSEAFDDLRQFDKN
jgi:hypothetical protein